MKGSLDSVVSLDSEQFFDTKINIHTKDSTKHSLNITVSVVVQRRFVADCYILGMRSIKSLLW